MLVLRLSQSTELPPDDHAWKLLVARGHLQSVVVMVPIPFNPGRRRVFIRASHSQLNGAPKSVTRLAVASHMPSKLLRKRQSILQTLISMSLLY